MPIITRAAAVLFVLLLPVAVFAHSAMDRFWGEVPVDMLLSGDVLVTRTLTVPEDVTLTVEPGTVVRFEGSEDGGNRIVIRGRLIAMGNNDAPIKFTAKDSNSGPWFGIEFSGGGTGRMEHCIIEGSTNGVVSGGAGVETVEVEVR